MVRDNAEGCWYGKGRVSWRHEMVIWDDGMEWCVMVDGMVVCIGGVERWHGMVV